jgi:hypothetical protein
MDDNGKYWFSLWGVVLSVIVAVGLMITYSDVKENELDIAMAKLGYEKRKTVYCTQQSYRTEYFKIDKGER